MSAPADAVVRRMSAFLTAVAKERETRVKILHMARTGERKPTTYRRAKRRAPEGWAPRASGERSR